MAVNHTERIMEWAQHLDVEEVSYVEGDGAAVDRGVVVRGTIVGDVCADCERYRLGLKQFFKYFKCVTY